MFLYTFLSSACLGVASQKISNASVAWTTAWATQTRTTGPTTVATLADSTIVKIPRLLVSLSTDFRGVVERLQAFLSPAKVCHRPSSGGQRASRVINAGAVWLMVEYFLFPTTWRGGRV